MLQGKVLIVDDNPVRRQVLGEYLTELNYSFVEASNGKEAIEIFEHEPFDMIFMDLHMPIMNGIDTTKYIRTKLSFPKNRVIIIANTVYNYKDFFDDFYNVGFNDIIPNPYTIQTLSNLINYHKISSSR
ncbi:MAG: response regulator [Bacteroidales bacterium]|jgi:CheY-like chemotaxis protein|nr:response regulator [Bacteroidales bacterium]